MQMAAPLKPLQADKMKLNNKEAYMPEISRLGKQMRLILVLLGAGLLLILMLIQLAGPVLSWPRPDEGNYTLHALKITQGQLPYQDFYDFVTPGSMLIVALLIKLNGFSMVGIRLWVIIGWLVQILLVYQMAKRHMPLVWLGLFVAFLALTDARYPINQHHFWSGFAAVLAVFFAWKHLQQVYAGNVKPLYLVLSAVFSGVCLWTTQSLGVAITGALGLFSLLHCFLHEREEKGISYRQVSNWQVLQRWARSWGRYWALPLLLFHGGCVAILWMLGIWPEFVRDVIQWLAGGHYNKTTVLGYFPTFSGEFVQTVKPLIDGVPMPFMLLFAFRIPIAIHLFLIGLLPVLGILSTGYLLPNRFVYRLLQREDEELLLFWIAAVAMVIASMTYCTSMHLVSNGALAFLLGWLAMVRWITRRPRLERAAQMAVGGFCFLVLLGGAIGSGIQLVLGSWLPPFKNLPESLVYTETRTTAPQLLEVIQLLDEAKAQNRSVFIFKGTPSLYFPGDYQNATRFIWIVPVYTSKAQIAEILADLEKNRPLYIIDDQNYADITQDARFSQHPPEQLRLPELEHYLKTHYVLQATHGQFLVYRRNTYFN
jgi:hypothetical protein